jgi:hypothetical protein
VRGRELHSLLTCLRVSGPAQVLNEGHFDIGGILLAEITTGLGLGVEAVFEEAAMGEYTE